LAYSLGQQSVGEYGASRALRWHELRDHPIAIGHQHGLAAFSETNVLTELIF
jgi:hypothetical protein